MRKSEINFDRWSPDIKVRRKVITEGWIPPVKPYLRKYMMLWNAHGRNTICSIIRDIYLLTDDEEIKIRCRVAMRMSKSMHYKLVEYKEMFTTMKEMNE